MKEFQKMKASKRYTILSFGEKEFPIGLGNRTIKKIVPFVEEIKVKEVIFYFDKPFNTCASIIYTKSHSLDTFIHTFHPLDCSIIWKGNLHYIWDRSDIYERREKEQLEMLKYCDYALELVKKEPVVKLMYKGGDSEKEEFLKIIKKAYKKLPSKKRMQKKYQYFGLK